MLFKDLKSGYLVFLFDRNEIEVKQGKVINVGIPRIDSRIGSPTEMVVDVTIENNGNKTYILKDSADIGYTGSLMISVTREGILREVEAIKARSEDALSHVDKHHIVIEKCSKILEEFNPQLKEKRETDERLSKLEGSIGEIKNTLVSFIKELKG